MCAITKMLGRIKEEKKRRGITNIQLSELTDIPIGTLNKILSGDSKDPQVSSIIRIAKSLNVSADYLIFGEDRGSQNKILRLYNSLNEIGKQKATEYILDLSEQPKYTKPQEAESDHFPEFQIAAYEGAGVETGKANATYEELKKLFDDM